MEKKYSRYLNSLSFISFMGLHCRKFCLPHNKRKTQTTEFSSFIAKLQSTWKNTRAQFHDLFENSSIIFLPSKFGLNTAIHLYCLITGETHHKTRVPQKSVISRLSVIVSKTKLFQYSISIP